MTPLQSSVLRDADYDAASQRLTLTFHSGGTYTYDNVPPALFHELTRAQSPGRFFQDTIKPRYTGALQEEPS